jgi:transposase-like protein
VAPHLLLHVCLPYAKRTPLQVALAREGSDDGEVEAGRSHRSSSKRRRGLLCWAARARAAAARSLGVVELILGNCVSEHRAGTLKGAGSKPEGSAEQMENRSLRWELARVTMGRDIFSSADEDLSVGTLVWRVLRA